MPKITKAQHAKGSKLWAACNAAHTAIFQGEMNVSWNECYRKAPADLRRAYDDAMRELRSFELQLVRENRGYINAWGHFAETGHVMSPWI